MTERRSQNKAVAEAVQTAKAVADQAAKVAQQVVDKATETAEKVLLFAQTIQFIQNDIAEIKARLDNKYVTKEEFMPTRMIAYGLVGLIIMGVVAAIFKVIFIK